MDFERDSEDEKDDSVPSQERVPNDEPSKRAKEGSRDHHRSWNRAFKLARFLFLDERFPIRHDDSLHGSERNSSRVSFLDVSISVRLSAE